MDKNTATGSSPRAGRREWIGPLPSYRRNDYEPEGRWGGT